MRLGPEGQSAGAEFRVTNMESPMLSVGKLVKQGYQLEAGPTRCRWLTGDRSVTLEVGCCEEFLSGWTSELARRVKELAVLMQGLLYL